MTLKNFALLSALSAGMLVACNSGTSSSSSGIQYTTLNYSGTLLLVIVELLLPVQVFNIQH